MPREGTRSQTGNSKPRVFPVVDTAPAVKRTTKPKPAAAEEPKAAAPAKGAKPTGVTKKAAPKKESTVAKKASFSLCSIYGGHVRSITHLCGISMLTQATGQGCCGKGREEGRQDRRQGREEGREGCRGAQGMYHPSTYRQNLPPYRVACEPWLIDVTEGAQG